jgi:hypothetical protein
MRDRMQKIFQVLSTLPILFGLLSRTTATEEHRGQLSETKSSQIESAQVPTWSRPDLDFFCTVR